MGYATDFPAMLATRMTPADLAERLGLSAVRRRQLIRDHSVFAIRVEGWCVGAKRGQSESSVGRA